MIRNNLQFWESVPRGGDPLTYCRLIPQLPILYSLEASSSVAGFARTNISTFPHITSVYGSPLAAPKSLNHIIYEVCCHSLRLSCPYSKSGIDSTWIRLKCAKICMRTSQYLKVTKKNITSRTKISWILSLQNTSTSLLRVLVCAYETCDLFFTVWNQTFSERIWSHKITWTLALPKDLLLNRSSQHDPFQKTWGIVLW